MRGHNKFFLSYFLLTLIEFVNKNINICITNISTQLLQCCSSAWILTESSRNGELDSKEITQLVRGRKRQPTSWNSHLNWTENEAIGALAFSRIDLSCPLAELPLDVLPSVAGVGADNCYKHAHVFADSIGLAAPLLPPPCAVGRNFVFPSCFVMKRGEVLGYFYLFCSWGS